MLPAFKILFIACCVTHFGVLNSVQQPHPLVPLLEEREAKLHTFVHHCTNLSSSFAAQHRSKRTRVRRNRSLIYILNFGT